MSNAHWSIAIYCGTSEPITSPTYMSEQEARKAFNSPDAFEIESLPESYAAVLWEMKEDGAPSAVLSKVVSMPTSMPEVWSPSF
jgi:hypothetical protein